MTMSVSEPEISGIGRNWPAHCAIAITPKMFGKWFVRFCTTRHLFPSLSISNIFYLNVLDYYILNVFKIIFEMSILQPHHERSIFVTAEQYSNEIKHLNQFKWFCKFGSFLGNPFLMAGRERSGLITSSFGRLCVRVCCIVSEQEF